ncbi:MAG TPA: hypothetical protein PK064_08695 [Bacteroidales bacterium]|nr:hypothetical protein [Bacteroidales bacterium]
MVFNFIPAKSKIYFHLNESKLISFSVWLSFNIVNNNLVIILNSKTISPSPLGEGREGGPGKNKNQLHLPPWGKAGKGVLERTETTSPSPLGEGREGGLGKNRNHFTFTPGGRQGRGSCKK